MTGFFWGATATELVAGDPGELETLATTLALVGDGLGTAASELRAIDAGGWTGTAAAAFMHVLRQEPTEYESAACAFATAGGALRTYAASLAAAQHAAGNAIQEWEAAESASAAWRRRCEAARQAGHHLTEPRDPGESGRIAAQRTLDGARADLNDAATRLRATLARAADQAPRAPRLLGRLVSEIRRLSGAENAQGLLALYHAFDHVEQALEVRDWLGLRAAAESWNEVAPGSPLAEYADELMREHFPTWNNGLGGRVATNVLEHTPGGGRLAAWLGDSSRATPWFRFLGIPASALGTAEGVDSIVGDVRHGAPGGKWAVDITGTAFSGSTTAFLIAPSPVTAIAMGVTGVAFGAAEAWEHRDAIAHLGKDALTLAWNTSMPGMLWNNRHEIGTVLDHGADLASSALHGTEHALASLNPF